MLIEFRVDNFRSFASEQSLSFVAGRDDNHPSHCIETGVTAAPRLLRSAAIYGPNASGKSNLVFALVAMQHLVLRSTQIAEPVLPQAYTPFSLDPELARKPTRFEVTLLLDGVRYQYGFAFDARRIAAEWLLVYRAGKAQRWFEYEVDEASGQRVWQPFSVHFKGEKRGQRETWRANTRETALFLTQAVQSNSQMLKPVHDWFARNLIILPARAQFDPGMTLARLADAQFKRRALGLLQSADVDVSDLRVVSRRGPHLRVKVAPGQAPELSTSEREALDVEFWHIDSAGESHWFDRRFESLGTQQLLSYAGPLLDVLDEGKLLVVDEFDASLHPLLVRHILGMFQDPRLSPKGAQLCLTTHDTSLLDPEILRRDQVWFVEKKAQRSELYSLLEFSPRKGESFGRWYLQGRYGAIPFLTEPVV